MIKVPIQGGKDIEPFEKVVEEDGTGAIDSVLNNKNTKQHKIQSNPYNVHAQLASQRVRLYSYSLLVFCPIHSTIAESIINTL